jgi:hypothetical protein
MTPGPDESPYQDPSGIFWRKDEQTGDWQRFDGSGWVPSDSHPPGLAPEVPPLPPTALGLAADAPAIPPTPIGAPMGKAAHRPKASRKRWPAVLAVVVLIAVVAVVVGVAASSGKKTPETTTPPGSAQATTPPLASTPTTSPQPTNLAIGTVASITSGGNPLYNVTVTQVVNPAQPADQYVTPQNPGDVFVAVEFTLNDTGTANVSDDIYNDAKVYDTAGQGFEGDFEDTSSGPSFPSGEIDIAPGGTASGWVMFEIPGSATLATVTYTPSSGFATQATASWRVGS